MRRATVAPWPRRVHRRALESATRRRVVNQSVNSPSFSSAASRSTCSPARALGGLRSTDRTEPPSVAASRTCQLRAVEERRGNARGGANAHRRDSFEALDETHRSRRCPMPRVQRWAGGCAASRRNNFAFTSGNGPRVRLFSLRKTFFLGVIYSICAYVRLKKPFTSFISVCSWGWKTPRRRA